MADDSREIRVTDWRRFLDGFSRTHLGSPVTIQFVGERTGVQTIARNLPLLGITLDKADDGKPQIQVTAGDAAHAHIMHVVRNPVRLWVTKMFNGQDQAFKIETLLGDYLLIEFGGLARSA